MKHLENIGDYNEKDYDRISEDDARELIDIIRNYILMEVSDRQLDCIVEYKNANKNEDMDINDDGVAELFIDEICRNPIKKLGYIEITIMIHEFKNYLNRSNIIKDIEFSTVGIYRTLENINNMSGFKFEKKWNKIMTSITEGDEVKEIRSSFESFDKDLLMDEDKCNIKIVFSVIGIDLSLYKKSIKTFEKFNKII